MRLCKIGMAGALAWCVFVGGNASSTNGAPELAGAASDGMLMGAHTAEHGTAQRFASNWALDFQDVRRAAQPERIQLAFASPPLPTALTVPGLQSDSGTFAATKSEQPPSLWLMGSIIVFLIAYQLGRKHKLLRPHRFHEL
jgi:hypothetical protein